MTSHLVAITTAGFFVDIGRSLNEALFMFYDTLWALGLGFALSGGVQSFASRASLQQRLGDHRPPAVARAAGYGMVSSSCSYAASALAKSLFQQGADFVASMVFMFASTNLVLELGVVLIVLLGWQFAAAQFIGGVIMITLLALAGDRCFGGPALEEARRRVAAGAPGDHRPTIAEATPWRQRLASPAKWSDAASYTLADLKMLRREILVGYGVAGFLATLVPTQIWNDLFVRGHGSWTALENVAVGPFIAVISFVCSIGNVPLAAALWKGGISFGGVVSFIFADLIAMPLLFIYRKLYGRRMARRMLAVFWAAMSLAGLATELIFRAAGVVPSARPTVIAAERFSWGYTSGLDLVLVAALAALWYLARNRDRFGGVSDYAFDPVCGMQVERAHAPAASGHAGATFFFCSDHCRDRFVVEPPRYLERSGVPGGPTERARLRR